MTRASTSFAAKFAALTRRPDARQTGAEGDEHAATEDLRAKPALLRETDVFAKLTNSEQEWLAHNTTMISCEAGRVLYAPDEPGEVIYILKRGSVNLFRLAPDGRKLVVDRVESHTIFGEMGFMGQAMYGCFAEAAEECLLCVLSRSDLTTLIRGNPDIALSIMTEMGRRLHQREEELESLAFQTVPARLATFLLRHADADGTVSGLTHEDIANRIGTYRETVSQTLGRFRADGLISTEPRCIRLRDTARLRDRSAG